MPGERDGGTDCLSGEALTEDLGIFVDEEVLDRRLVVLSGRGTREGPTTSCSAGRNWSCGRRENEAGDAPVETSDCPARANIFCGGMRREERGAFAGSSWCVELAWLGLRLARPGRALLSLIAETPSGALRTQRTRRAEPVRRPCMMKTDGIPQQT